MPEIGRHGRLYKAGLAAVGRAVLPAAAARLYDSICATDDDHFAGLQATEYVVALTVNKTAVNERPLEASLIYEHFPGL